jgi:hypothetical protein
MQTAPDGPLLPDNLDQQNEVIRRQITETMMAFNRTVDPAKLTSLSKKSLAEVNKLQQEIAGIVPMGNVPSLILNSLIQLKGQVVSPERAQRDIEALMRGVEVVRKMFYGAAFFVSPAAVLYAYQKMLTLAGKDVHSAFPEGLWQFYLEFSMREDTARHTNETIGFHRSLTAHNLDLSLSDQLAAWVTAVINLYFQYDDLLLTDWSERVYLNLLETEAEKANCSQDSFFLNLKKKWMKQRPYRREQDVAVTETYAQYRRRKFERFCQPRLQGLPQTHRQEIAQAYQNLLRTEAPAFQEQMSILATLDPGRYREIRRPIPLWQARVAVIWQNEYHLLPACAVNAQGEVFCFSLEDGKIPPVALTVNRRGQLTHPSYGVVIARRNGLILTDKTNVPIGRLQPLPPHQVRHWIWAILNNQYLSNLNATEFDITLLKIPRSEQEKVRRKLSATSSTDLELLKMAPILIHWDQRDLNQPLAEARLGWRGVGDHALTIFRTQETMIFDLSHVFFDGIWALSLVEILTNEAISWASYFAQLAPLKTAKVTSPRLDKTIVQVVPEAWAESKAADLEKMMCLRKNLVQRSSDMVFTINDLLILYRAIFNREYQPAPELVAAVDDLAKTYPQQSQGIRQAWQQLPTINPALLIPMDSIDGSPKDRLYPITFRNPFPEFLDLFYQTYNALEAYQQTNTPDSWQLFSQLRNQLVQSIYHFGQLMLVHKKLALTGEMVSLTSLKLLGHLPDAVQSMFGKLPQKFDFLNEMLSGEEVFSNVGRVARGASPVRFISARDDNNAKKLVWGVLTDDNEMMHISLRDFRSEVIALFDIDRADLAQMMARDFLDGYVAGLNNFTHKLNQIAAATVEGTG